MTPWLSQSEIDELCEPLTQHAAQIRFLTRLGIPMRGKRPNGAPVVWRSDCEAAQTGKKTKPVKTQPDRAGLRLAYSKG